MLMLCGSCGIQSRPCTAYPRRITTAWYLLHFLELVKAAVPLQQSGSPWSLSSFKLSTVSFPTASTSSHCLVISFTVGWWTPSLTTLPWFFLHQTSWTRRLWTIRFNACNKLSRHGNIYCICLAVNLTSPSAFGSLFAGSGSKGVRSFAQPRLLIATFVYTKAFNGKRSPLFAALHHPTRRACLGFI